jgi:hypothetical protein
MGLDCFLVGAVVDVIKFIVKDIFCLLVQIVAREVCNQKILFFMSILDLS